MSERSPVTLSIADGIGWIIVDNPPVNATSHAVRTGIVEALTAALADERAKAIVLACEGTTFVAGADIREFGKPPVAPILPDVCLALEEAGKPVVAALHGSAFGGGLELAMACHARVAAQSAVMGLPEVKLGLIPGAGGTQRLPRLVGPLAALDMIGTGRTVKAAEALSLGLVDEIADGDLRQAAAAMALALSGPSPTLARPVPAVEREAFDAAAARIASRARGQIAPLRAADALRAALDLPAAEGLRRERDAFLELVASPQSAALRHLFFAEREVARVPLLDGVKGRRIGSAGVIGGGTMGAGIAVCFADAGIPVVVIETSAAAAQAARERIAGLYERQVKSGRLDPARRDARMASITISEQYEALADADIVVEAAFEDMAVKVDIFRRLAAATKSGAVLATNTSALDIDAIAAASGRPADVIGLHFFSPATVMRLVEVVRGAQSDPVALATASSRPRRSASSPSCAAIATASSATASSPCGGSRPSSRWRTVRCRRTSTPRSKPSACQWVPSRFPTSRASTSAGRAASASRRCATPQPAMPQPWPMPCASRAASARRPGAAGTATWTASARWTRPSPRSSRRRPLASASRAAPSRPS